MDALKKNYDDIPETIKIPKQFTHKKGEIIILTDDVPQKTDTSSKRRLLDFYGAIPDFPERFKQGEYEGRKKL